MNIKDEVLLELSNNVNGISGQAIAEKIFVSRNAVWKAVKQLKAEGYNIEAINNKGYKLINDNNIISKPAILSKLKNNTLCPEVYVLGEVDSTNNYARILAENGAENGTVVVSDCQTKGKGRKGRSFASPKGSGIYMSFIYNDNISPENSALFTIKAAVAASEAIESVADIDVKIKWVNDLIVNNKKICGILTEASMDFETNNFAYVIIGIGINVYKTNFPREITEIATTIEDNSSSVFSRTDLISSVINKMSDYIYHDDGEIIEKYRSRSCVIDKEITVITLSETYDAKVVAIDKTGRLKVITESGDIKYLNSGEISIKSKQKGW